MKIFNKYFGHLLIIYFLINLISCNNQKQDTTPKNIYYYDSTGNKLSASAKQTARKDTFNFKIHEKLPVYKFIITIDELTFITEIQIYRSTVKNLVQKISTDSLNIQLQRTPESDQYFFTKDFNFDGYEDIVLLEDCGATGNQTYGVWLFNKLKRIFETNSFFISIDRPTLDKDKKQITTFMNYGGADEYLYRTYKLIKNQFVLINEVKYWRNYKEKQYIPMKDSSIICGDTLKLISRSISND